MLAEIFMVRLETRARLASEAAPPGGGRFVPFVQGSQVAFKKHARRPYHPGLLPAAVVSPDRIESSTH
jgi:hypothetical protein